MNRQCTGSALPSLPRRRPGAAVGDVVLEWTGADATWLQQALRLTNEAFAERLGCSPRAVAKWHADPGIVLRLEMQQALDIALARAEADERNRFDTLRAPPSQPVDLEGAAIEEWGRRLAEARHLHGAIRWLSDRGDDTGPPVAERIIAQAARRARGVTAWHTHPAAAEPGRSAVECLRAFYRNGIGDHGFLDVTVGGTTLTTSMLVHDAWLHLAQDLDGRRDRFRYDPSPPPEPPSSADLTAAAVDRIGDVLVDDTRFVDGEIYRLTRLDVGPDGLEADFGTGSFARYALTWDLLESETATAAVLPHPQASLPLREHLLPDVASILNPATRLCMGGVLALAAFARPATNRHPADYVLLVQERGERVVNASRRLAVVPKCFHEPAGDPGEDADIRQSLVRELEEELLGREELDTTVGAPALAVPLHPTRLTEPTRWLLDHDAMRLELTAFGFNVVSGNFEMPCLVQVTDDGFWTAYGGSVVANWEVARLRRVSSMDPDALARLIEDPAWSSEGLYAFVAGLLRLAHLDPARVRLPPLTMGVTR